MTVRYQVTVRADDIELRGRIDGHERLQEIGQALANTGAMVIASVSRDQPDGPVPMRRTDNGDGTDTIEMTDGTEYRITPQGAVLDIES